MDRVKISNVPTHRQFLKNAALTAAMLAAGGIDFLPTFCELAGAKAPSDRVIDGTSITPLLAGGRVQRHAPLCWNINFMDTPNMAMRMGDEVLVGFASAPADDQSLMKWIKSSRLEHFEMYDVRKDPGQTKDLSLEFPVRFDKLVLRMKQLWAELQEAGPVWKGYKGRIKPVQLMPGPECS